MGAGDRSNTQQKTAPGSRSGILTLTVAWFHRLQSSITPNKRRLLSAPEQQRKFAGFTPNRLSLI